MPKSAKLSNKETINVVFLTLIWSAISLLVLVDGKVVVVSNFQKTEETELVDPDEDLDSFYDYEDLLKLNFEDYEDYEPITTEDDLEGYQVTEEKASKDLSPQHRQNGRCPDSPFHYPSICKAKRCKSDEDCSGYWKHLYEFICCFNGCVNTCVRKTDPPMAFDWLEETELRPLQNKTYSTSWSGEPKLETKSYGSSSEKEKIHLPGGCQITTSQLHDLRLFKKFDHVETCTCVNGDVVCQVNPKEETRHVAPVSPSSLSNWS